ncbi:MAG: hypothetical protein U0235_04125 [Polyangiaceae bacterium]
MNKTTTRTGLAFKTAVLAATVCGLGAVAAGCITRPISPQQPTTKTNFTAVVRQAAIDKIDLLFAIDNSASMGDKQELLGQAVPDLVGRLLTPQCVDENDPTKVTGTSTTDAKTGDATCPNGSKPEFPPVHDMHIGIVSSSLGGRGSDQCAAGSGHSDDKGHLLNRATKSETTVASATPSNFLAWLPTNEKNNSKSRDKNVVGSSPYTDQAAFAKDFADLIVGVRENGCGYEAQLESMYRFLMQPDPYNALVKDGDAVKYDGYDFELLKQRHDFLRPDSLLAVIMITDENESSVAPTGFGGRAWFYEDSRHVRPGTQVCATNPNDPGCKPCYLKEAESDPGCSKTLDDTTDNINLRFFHMKQRFGIDPRYPIQRYTRGLTKTRVPSRDNEFNGFDYVGDNDDKATCVNPIFATNLPTDGGQDLCGLTVGSRTSDLVYFALIGGVPWQFLTNDPDNLSSSYNGRTFKDRLSGNDWTRILGADPLKYDFTGQHYLMQESVGARPGAQADQVHDREWNTANGDLQYACTIELPSAKDCSLPANKDACDCDKPTDSPLCDSSNKTTQTRGKAYPTISQLAVAKALGDQAIVSSICPPDPKNKTLNGQDNPFYGYRPAVRAIIDRLKNSLASQCLPQELSADPQGKVPCLILELFQDGANCADKGLSIPDPKIVAKFKEAKKAELGSSVDKATVCQADQILPADFVGDSCEKTKKAGWCYLTGKAAGGSCPQAIKFSADGNPVGAQVSLQCIKSNDAADSGAP